LKKEFPAEWKTRVLLRINAKTGFTDAKGKWHYSPLYTWAKGLFSNSANDGKWATLAERLSPRVATDALEVCRRALFSFPPRKFPWNSPAAVAKARKNAAELAAFLRKWDDSQLARQWVADTAEGLEGLAAFLERAENPVQRLADGKFEVGGIIMPQKPGQGRRPVDPINYSKPGVADWRFWRATSMLDTFFRERFGPTHPKHEAAALLLSIWDPEMYDAEDNDGIHTKKFKRMLRTIKKNEAVPTPTPAPW
jgi:hypothetical protein